MKPKWVGLTVDAMTKDGGLMTLKLPTTLFFPDGRIEAIMDWDFKSIQAERTLTL